MIIIINYILMKMIKWIVIILIVADIGWTIKVGD